MWTRSPLGRLRLASALCAAALLLAAGCGEDAPSDYSAENKDAFLAACTDAVGDDLLQQRVCLCVFEESSNEIPFERFVEIDDVFAGDPVAPLPDDLAALVARCVIDEADL